MIWLNLGRVIASSVCRAGLTRFSFRSDAILATLYGFDRSSRDRRIPQLRVLQLATAASPVSAIQSAL